MTENTLFASSENQAPSIPFDPDPAVEIQSGADDRVILYGHPGLCRTSEEVLASRAFVAILEKFIQRLEAHQSPLLEAMRPFLNGGAGALAAFLRSLYSGERKSSDLENPLGVKQFIEELYSFWRKRERFVFFDRTLEEGITDLAQYHQVFIRANEQFKELVLSTYRRLCANATGDWFRVYRQLPAGAGVGLLTEKVNWPAPTLVYEKLKVLPIVRLCLMYPPLIYYPKRSKRKGKYTPIGQHPLEKIDFDAARWLVYPAKIGELLILIVFHKDFLSHVAGLSNLFELATAEELEGRKPDGFVLFGVPEEVLEGKRVAFYEDKAAGCVVGLVAHHEDVDYFGYFKKTALTVHNLIMMEKGALPIHGAMARIELRTGKTANVVIVGDSGAGKSESLEAFRILADQYIRRLTVIFDDMGSLSLNDQGQVVGKGTEIGAFVRLDDLHPGYAYTEIDRSVFMNPHLGNARLVIPITEYRDVVAGYPVDMFLYANNYDSVDEEHPYLEVMRDPVQIEEVFSSGARLAKGTTDEKGLVHTYFANPFGAPQKRERHEALAEHYIKQLLKTGKICGQLRTQLGIQGMETKGPEEAARALFRFITESL